MLHQRILIIYTVQYFSVHGISKNTNNVQYNTVHGISKNTNNVQYNILVNMLHQGILIIYSTIF